MNMQAGFQLLNVIILLVLLSPAIYLFILTVNFLKAGSLAFRIYIDKNKKDYDN